MSKKSVRDMKPFASILIAITLLLGVAFVKMETRRLSYSILKISRTEKRMVEARRKRTLRFARLTRPDRIEDYAKVHLELRKAGKGQIIQLAGHQLALRQ